ncbi:Integrase catalytic domain-containing protein [Aphis craccivora]|uniref:Integrase catalytic domain-containing protein n=1 Tax=Aphis craccivora TaxID=307492 RepID=A0A6G0W7Y6_APHCR|nr:Integrase catalytic domain-containing protein [Aphis craccivora]
MDKLKKTQHPHVLYPSYKYVAWQTNAQQITFSYVVFKIRLSTENFIATLRRFIAHRGHPSVISSDNGTNFPVTNNKLCELYKLVKQPDHQLSYLILAKHLICQIEAILNSRPLQAVSMDTTDYSALTPGHFLIGRPLLSLPEPEQTEVSLNRLTRPKWRFNQPNLQVDDLVVVKGIQTSSTQWPLARITQLLPCISDGQVRVVKIHTAVAELTDPSDIFHHIITSCSQPEIEVKWVMIQNRWRALNEQSFLPIDNNFIDSSVTNFLVVS